MGLPRLATVWLGGCSGCHMSFLDLDEFLLELAPQVCMVFSPIMDVKKYPANVDLCLVEGAICNEDHLEMAKTIRCHTKFVVAFGDCAITGNVSAIRNQLGLGGRENVLQRAYVEAAQLNQCVPSMRGIVPPLLERVLPLHEVIPVDFFLTGCPPHPNKIRSFLCQWLAGDNPRLEGLDLKMG